MALFVVTCTDKPDSLDLRMATRPAHLEYLGGHPGKVVLGGPFLDDSERMTGSMSILDVADRAEAETFAANDPYAKAGLFADVRIKAWRWVINPPK